MATKTSYNPNSKALQVLAEGARIASSCEDPDDSLLVFSYNEARQVVGLLVLFADEMAPEEWEKHPGRERAPGELVSAVDRWLRERDGVRWAANLTPPVASPPPAPPPGAPPAAPGVLGCGAARGGAPAAPR